MHFEVSNDAYQCPPTLRTPQQNKRGKNSASITAVMTIEKMEAHWLAKRIVAFSQMLSARVQLIPATQWTPNPKTTVLTELSGAHDFARRRVRWASDRGPLQELLGLADLMDAKLDMGFPGVDRRHRPKRTPNLGLTELALNRPVLPSGEVLSNVRQFSGLRS